MVLPSRNWRKDLAIFIVCGLTGLSITLISLACFYPEILSDNIMLKYNDNDTTINTSLNDINTTTTTTTNDGGVDNNNNNTTFTTTINILINDINDTTTISNIVTTNTDNDNNNTKSTTFADDDDINTTIINTPDTTIEDNCVYENKLKKYPQDTFIEYKSNVQESYQKYIDQLKPFRKCLDLFNDRGDLLSMSCNEHLNSEYTTSSNYQYCSTNFWGYNSSKPCVVFTYGTNLSVIVFNHMSIDKDLNIECEFTSKKISNETISFRITIK